MSVLFSEIISRSRTKQIVDKFRQALADGSLKIGDKLPPERELSLQLGVSRTSLREAVRILDAYGLIESTQGGGTYVTDRFTENVFDFLGFGSRLSAVNFRHLLQTRFIIETGAVETAPDAILEPSLSGLSDLAGRMHSENSVVNLGSLDARFHEALVDLAGNPILTAFYRMIFKLLRQGTVEVIGYPTAKATAISDHAEIVQALSRCDRTACIAAIRRHLEHTEELIARHFDEGDSTPNHEST
jgi:GntR family transcriptional regulator, transcriptional repressor for pyruvate dehydrogenase complex